MAKIIWREPANSAGGGTEQRREGSCAPVEPKGKARKDDKLEVNVEAGTEQRREGLCAPVEPKGRARKDDKLEVNVDGAWYSANLCLREDGITTVHYDGYSEDEDDDHWDAEKIKGIGRSLRDHIRVESEALQDEACDSVHVNNVVCAIRRASSGEGWYDAVITAIRKRHDKPGAEGENCTCSFTVEWLNGPEKGRGSILGCGDICLHSTKDVKTHPLIVKILRHANQDDVEEGSADEQQEDQEDTNEEDEWIPEQELREVRQFKRLKLKSTAFTQVKAELDAEQKPVRQENDRSAHVSPDTELENVPSLSHSSEHKGASKPSGKMRGQIPFVGANTVFSNPYPLPGASSKSMAGAAPLSEDFKKQVKQGVRISPNADALQAQSSRGKILVDLKKDEDCKVDVKKEKVISPKADPSQDTKSEMQKGFNVDGVQEQNFSSKASSTPHPKVSVYFHTSEQPPGSSTSEVGDPQERAHISVKANPMPEVHTEQKKRAGVDIINEAQDSKKMRITVNFDIEMGHGKITSCSAKYEHPLDPAGISCAKATEVEAFRLKNEAPLDHTSIPSAKATEVEAFGLKNRAPLDHTSIPSAKATEGEAPRVKNEVPLDHTSIPSAKATEVEAPRVKKDVVKDSEDKSPLGPQKEEALGSSVKQEGSSAINAICLSDEEDDCVIASSTPPTSSKGLPDFISEGSPLTDEQEGWTAHLDSRSRKLRSSFVKNALTKSGLILLIDNLEVGVKLTDLMEILLKLCDKGRIQSLEIPPPYPYMNRQRAYVIFTDKEAADAATGVLHSGLVVSARGRPWVVSRPGQDNSGPRKPSEFMGNVQPGRAGSSGYRFVTRRQVSEYNAAKQRLRVFEQHRKQARVMSQRHAQEEKGLDAEDSSL